MVTRLGLSAPPRPNCSDSIEAGECVFGSSMSGTAASKIGPGSPLMPGGVRWPTQMARNEFETLPASAIATPPSGVWTGSSTAPSCVLMAPTGTVISADPGGPACDPLGQAATPGP